MSNETQCGMTTITLLNYAINMKKLKKKRNFSHWKVKLTEIEAIEREYFNRYNSELPKWQQEMYQ